MYSDKKFTASQLFFGIIISILIFLLGKVGTLDSLKVFFFTLTQGVRSSSYEAFNAVSADANFIGNIGKIREENKDLKVQVLALASENAKLKDQLVSAAAISKQLSFDLPYTLIPVRVSGYVEEKVGEVYINQGTGSGIKVGSIAVYEKYALGEVIEVNEQFAKVRLVTSSSTTIPVVVANKNIKGIVSGDQSQGIVMKEVLIDANLVSGDVLVTSGLNSNFPYGLLIGQIDSILSNQNDLMKAAKVSNEISYNTLTAIYIIK